MSLVYGDGRVQMFEYLVADAEEGNYLYLTYDISLFYYVLLLLIGMT